MTTLAILITFISVASATLLHALNHAVDGYEDEAGFHKGRAPQLANGLPIAVRADDHENLAWTDDARRNHLPNQIPGKALGAF